MGKVSKPTSLSRRFDPMKRPAEAAASSKPALQNPHGLNSRPARPSDGLSNAGQWPLAASLGAHAAPVFASDALAMPFVAADPGMGYPDAVARPEVDFTRQTDHDPQWHLSHGAAIVRSLSKGQVEAAFHSANQRHQKELEAASRQASRAKPIAHATTGFDASPRFLPGLFQCPQPAKALHRLTVVQRRLDAPANMPELQEKIRAKVMAATGHEGTADAYASTIRVMYMFMNNIDAKLGPDGAADMDDLLKKFLAHVGENSYAGMNAKSALDALRTDTVAIAPVPYAPEDAANPLGFSEDQLDAIQQNSHGPSGLRFAEKEWQNLSTWLSTDQIFDVLKKPGCKSALEALQDLGATLMKPVADGGLDATVHQLVGIASDTGGGPALRALKDIGIGLMASVGKAGLGMSSPQLLQVARRGGRLVLEALRDVGATLLDMGASTNDLTRLGSRSGRGEVLREIAKRADDVVQQRVTFTELKHAGLRTHKAVDAVGQVPNRIG